MRRKYWAYHNVLFDLCSGMQSMRLFIPIYTTVLLCMYVFLHVVLLQGLRLLNRTLG